MQEDTLRKLITFFFKYLWIVCGALIAINMFSMLNTAYSLVKKNAADALQAAGYELSRTIGVNYELLESLAALPQMQDTSIPVQDRAASLRPFVQPFGLWMIGVVDPDGSISSTLRYKWTKVSRDYIPRVLRTGQREMTDVFQAGATGDLNYTLLMPVKREGNVVSIVFIATKLQALQNMLAGKEYTSNGYYLLLDSKLNTLLHPSEILQNKNILALMDEERFIGSTREDIEQRFLQRESGEFIGLFRGELFYTRFMPLDHTTWTLIHRVRLVPTLHATLLGFSLQTGLYILVFGSLYFFGNAFILRRLAPVDAVLKQIIVLNRSIRNSDVLTDADTATLLELSRRGLKDELTGLPTRMFFRQMLSARLQEGAADSLCAIFYLDMDNLKKINDTFGHKYGDVAIRRVGQQLQQVALQHKALYARFGGDEFLLFVENLPDEDAAEAIGVQLLAQLAGTLSRNEETLSYGVSIGYSLYPTQTNNIDLAIQLADVALYETKQRGKGQCTRYTLGTPLPVTDTSPV